MTELGAVLEEIGLSQYLEIFIDHGFDTWEAFADITELDFDALGVKLGHRRKIQRKIANSRGIAAYQPLVSPAPNTPSDDRHFEESKSTIAKLDTKESSAHVPTGKRKYRRHPKPDENAPERRPSAYVIFSNKMRDDLKGRNLSFTEIAKLVGENWQSLAPSEKEPYETQAFILKEKFNADMTEYKKTDSFRKYMEYLADFKEKHPTQQQATDASKRPKLVNENSGGSSGVDSSAASQHSNEIPMGHGRGGSVGSVGQAWYSGDPLHTGLPNLNVAHGVPLGGRVAGSPVPPPSSNILPGYRDAIFGTNQQTLAWRENLGDADTPQTQQLPRIMDMSERRSGRLGTGPTAFDTQMTPASQSSLRATSYASPPPLLVSESTSGTTTSSTSSIFYPRTPLELSIDRSLPMPGHMYSSKPQPPPLYNATSQPQTQLPPLRASSSLSPKNKPSYHNSTSKFTCAFNAMDVFQEDPCLKIAPPSAQLPDVYFEFGSGTDVEQAIPGIADLSRGYAPSNHSPIVPLERNHTEEEALDPVSALLRADEIVSRQTPRR